jgi:hypothetical protein
MAVFELKNNKTTKVLVILITIFIMGAIVYKFIDNSQKTAAIDVIVAPASSKILIGNKHFPNGTHKIRPGEYSISITKDGFEPYSTKIIAKENETAQLKIFLLPSNGSYEWYYSHPEDAKLLDPIKDYTYTKNLDELKNKNPIINILPIQVAEYSNNYSVYTEFSINYKQTEADRITLVIDDITGGNENKALDIIRAKGFNPDEYNIEYNNASN